MSSLKVQRCFNHKGREAVARCTACGSYFCRECIAEHAGKMICARCLGQSGRSTGSARIRPLLVGSLQLMIGLVILWFCFFMAGRGLLAIPATVHEGTIWHMTGAQR